jgi:hypothetical protein
VQPITPYGPSAKETSHGYITKQRSGISVKRVAAHPSAAMHPTRAPQLLSRSDSMCVALLKPTSILNLVCG